MAPFAPPSVYALYMQYIFKSQAHTKLCVLTAHGRKKTQTSRSYHSCYQLQYVWKELVSFCFFVDSRISRQLFYHSAPKKIESNTVIAIQLTIQP